MTMTAGCLGLVLLLGLFSNGLAKGEMMERFSNGDPASSIPSAMWIKARKSSAQGNCIELALLPSMEVAVRNSRFPDSAALVFTPEEVAAWLDGAKNGEFDHMAA